MKRFATPVVERSTESGRAGKLTYAVALWLLGAPTLLVILALFARGCF